MVDTMTRLATQEDIAALREHCCKDGVGKSDAVELAERLLKEREIYRKKAISNSWMISNLIGPNISQDDAEELTDKDALRLLNESEGEGK